MLLMPDFSWLFLKKTLNVSQPSNMPSDYIFIYFDQAIYFENI